jgi:hypothetical protein
LCSLLLLTQLLKTASANTPLCVELSLTLLSREDLLLT